MHKFMSWALDDKRHSQKQFSAVRYDEKVLTTVITLGSPPPPSPLSVVPTLAAALVWRWC